MLSESHELMIGGIFALRTWCRDHLPIENSLIAYDLILVLAINNYAKNNISIKELFASVPHSYTAVRGHYLRFVNDGWVEHYLDSSDRRIKYVRPTPKLIRTINAYTKATSDIFAQANVDC
jgi:DNA-binding MarR family transcriptional regulator